MHDPPDLEGFESAKSEVSKSLTLTELLKILNQFSFGLHDELIRICLNKLTPIRYNDDLITFNIWTVKGWLHCDIMMCTNTVTQLEQLVDSHYFLQCECLAEAYICEAVIPQSFISSGPCAPPQNPKVLCLHTENIFHFRKSWSLSCSFHVSV